jgi:site-specific recombinase XerD
LLHLAVRGGFANSEQVGCAERLRVAAGPGQQRQYQAAHCGGLDIPLHGKELSENSNKAHSTRDVYGSYINTWILPEWGTHSLSDVRTVDVEAWLRGLPLANASKAKIRNIMSAVFTHAVRYEWADKNPISLVRQSAKRKRVPAVLTAEEIGALLAELR